MLNQRRASRNHKDPKEDQRAAQVLKALSRARKELAMRRMMMTKMPTKVMKMKAWPTECVN